MDLRQKNKSLSTQKIENNAKINSEIKQILQPLQGSKYLRIKFTATKNEKTTLFTLNDVTDNKKILAGYDEESPVSVSGKYQRIKEIFDVLFAGVSTSVIINYLKIQSDNENIFQSNPEIFSINEDFTTKSEQIELQDFINEYMYKDNILSVPVKFLLSGNSAFIWSLDSVLDTDETADVTITFYYQKVAGRILSI